MELKSYPVKFLGIDEETEAVRDYVSEGYPASEPADDRGEGQQAVQEGAQTWEEAGLENPMSQYQFQRHKQTWSLSKVGVFL